MAKFMVGERVQIVNHPDKMYIARVGKIFKVMDLSATRAESKTTGLYRVRINDVLIPKWLYDKDLERVEE